jgi:hypothetical protein
MRWLPQRSVARTRAAAAPIGDIATAANDPKQTYRVLENGQSVPYQRDKSIGQDSPEQVEGRLAPQAVATDRRYELRHRRDEAYP